MSNHICQWATATPSKTPHLTMSHHICPWATTSANEPQHLPMSHHISQWATTLPKETPHLTMSHQICQWATTSPNKTPHLTITMSHHICQWAITSHNEPSHLPKSHHISQWVTTSNESPHLPMSLLIKSAPPHLLISNQFYQNEPPHIIVNCIACLVGLVVVGKDARIERPTDSITRAWARIRQFLFFIKITWRSVTYVTHQNVQTYNIQNVGCTVR